MLWTASIRAGVVLMRTRRGLDRAVRQLAALGEFSTVHQRRVTDRHEDQAERLERRVNSLETALRRAMPTADMAMIDDHDWAASDSPPGERTVAAYQHLITQDASADTVSGAAVLAEKRQLRTEFAGLIHRGDYAGALVKGDEIVDRFPESTAARDFRRVRPHLLRRIHLAKRGAVN